MKAEHDMPQALTMTAYTLHHEQKDDQALALIARALELEPGYTFAHVVKAQINLSHGNYEEGWPGIEHLCHRTDADKYHMVRYRDRPLWDGKPTDKRLLLWSSMGLGDMIQMLRFLPAVRALAPNLIVDVRPELYELCVYNKVAPQVVRFGREDPEFDVHWPIMSLPLIFNLTLDSVSNFPTTYLKAPPAVFGNKHGCRAGIFWQSFSTISEESDARNLPYPALERLAAQIAPRRLLSLHQNDCKAFDLYDLARYIDSCEIVITVDTMLAHLAGAMGKRVFLMISKRSAYLWLQNRADTPWYPTMRIFRQDRLNDWTNVVDEVAAALEEELQGPDPEPKTWGPVEAIPYYRTIEKPRTLEALGR